MDAVCASYLMTVDAVRVILAEAGLGREDTTQVLCTNAERFYRL